MNSLPAEFIFISPPPSSRFLFGHRKGEKGGGGQISDTLRVQYTFLSTFQISDVGQSRLLFACPVFSPPARHQVSRNRGLSWGHGRYPGPFFSRLSLVAKNGWSKRSLRQPLFFNSCCPPAFFFIIIVICSLPPDRILKKRESFV